MVVRPILWICAFTRACASRYCASDAFFARSSCPDSEKLHRPCTVACDFSAREHFALSNPNTELARDGERSPVLRLLRPLVKLFHGELVPPQPLSPPPSQTPPCSASDDAGTARAAALVAVVGMALLSQPNLQAKPWTVLVAFLCAGTAPRRTVPRRNVLMSFAMDPSLNFTTTAWGAWGVGLDHKLWSCHLCLHFQRVRPRSLHTHVS
jgi:hypothetical protein